jgi:ABC-2 type transport system permease protein
MKKYWVVLKNSLQSGFVYRLNFFISVLAELFFLLVIIYLWTSVYGGGGKIGTYGLSNIIFYFIFSRLILLIVNSEDIGRQVGETIRSGELVNFLLKPINFTFKQFFDTLGKSIFRFVIFFIIYFFVFLFFKQFWISALTMIYFLISLLIAFAIYFLTFYIVGISTFYFGFIAGLNFTMFGLINFFSGGIMPIDLFPKYVSSFLNILPFKYIIFVPISIVTGKIPTASIPQEILFGFAWIFILFLISKILFKKGLKNYEAYGF